MDNYKNFTRKALVEKIRELETVIELLKKEKDEHELTNFPWAGNLGNWYWNVKNNTVIFNEQKVLALKYEKDELPCNIGYEFFTDKIHPDDYETVMDNMRQHLMRKTSAYEVEYRIRAKDGSWKWFYDRGKVTKRDEKGKALIVAGIVFDITEEKEAAFMMMQQNKKLQGMVNIDYLTNIFNRKALQEKLAFEISMTSSNRKFLSVLLIDIDYFKPINDTYGHLAGDAVLKQVALIIKKSVRHVDIVCRYGGEEFLIILPDCNSKQGYAISERIRKSIEEHEFPNKIRITVSGGLKEYKNEESIEKLLEEADRYLYIAKDRGRNRIVSEDNLIER